MVEPHFARIPSGVIERSNEWVAAFNAPDEPVPTPPATDPRASSATPQAMATSEARLLAPDGTPLRESFLTIPNPSGTMFGVLSEPLGERAGLAALFIGGTGHRIGPNRMWVEAARRWSSLGVPCLRLDVTGTGEAEGMLAPDVPGLYTGDFSEQVEIALGAMAERGLPRRVIVVSLCASTYWAVQVASRSDHDIVAVLLNPKRLVWDARLYAEQMTRYYLEGLAQASNWKRLVRGELSLAGARKIVGRRLVAAGNVVRDRRSRAAVRERVDRLLDDLRDRGVPVSIVFTGRESLHEEFKREGRIERMGRWPNVTIEVVPGREGLHTLKPIWLQHRVHELLDEGLRRELARAQTGVPGQHEPVGSQANELTHAAAGHSPAG
jgi:hypothetical protein